MRSTIARDPQTCGSRTATDFGMIMPRSTVMVAGAMAALMFVTGCDSGPRSPASSTDQAAPAGVPSASIGTTIDDTAITTRVKSALLADPDIKSLDITVETLKSEVQLSGFVDTQAQIERAVDLAGRSQGVTAVQNKLAIKAPVTVGNSVDDTIVTAKVKAALLRDDAIRSLDIAVSTNKGEVQLSGFVANDTQIARATELARQVEGVASVDNRMSLKK